MYRRILHDPLVATLADTPAVLLTGARQTGKTTLIQQVIGGGHPAAYVTLDDIGVLAAARADPAGFIAGFSGPVAIDEIQHAPELLRAIKLAIDRDRSPGRFLLTGSANVLVLPKVSESLAGRVEVLTLWPLAQSEIAGTQPGIIDRLFEAGTPIATTTPPVDRADLLHRILAGGYPEPLARSSEARRRSWFTLYVTTILQRDVREIAQVEGLTALPRLLALLAARSSSLLNLADLSRDSTLPYSTLRRYMALLEATFLLAPIPAWSTNLSARQAKAPKVSLNDTGLAAALLGVDEQRIERPGTLLGALLESFVAMELRKLIGASTVQPRPYHYRTYAGDEVDLLLEDAAGRLVGVEVKASATVGASDFRGLRALQALAGDRFVRGLVLYTGGTVIPFGPALHAAPVCVLWA